MVSLFIEQLVSITDVVYLGRLGAVELGAAALGSTYFIMLFMVPFGFSIGARIIMAYYHGAGHLKKIGPVFYQGLFFLPLVCLVLILLSYVFTPYLMKFLIDSQDVLRVAQQYLFWRSLGLLPIGALMMMQAFFIAITKTQILTAVSLMMVFSNVVLNYVLIFGKFGFPRMEIAGAALASDIAEVIAICFYAFCFLRYIPLQKYALQRFVWRNLKILYSILRLSVWTVVQEIGSVFTWFLFFVAIEHLGTDALAVSNIIRSISAFPYIAVHALSATASTISGNLIGLKRDQELLPTCRRIVLLGVFLLLPMLILMLVFEPFVLILFTNDAHLKALSSVPYQVMLTTTIPLLSGWVFFSAVSGIGQTRKAFFMELMATAVYAFYTWLFILHLKLSLAIAWGADFVYGLFLFVLAYWYLRSGVGIRACFDKFYLIKHIFF